MQKQPSGLDTLFAFLASIVLDAMVFPSVEEGLTRAPNSPAASAIAGGVIRWLVRTLLLPVEIIAQLMTFIGMLGMMYYAVFIGFTVLVYVIAVTWKFLADGDIPDLTKFIPKS